MKFINQNRPKKKYCWPNRLFISWFILDCQHKKIIKITIGYLYRASSRNVVSAVPGMTSLLYFDTGTTDVIETLVSL